MTQVLPVCRQVFPDNLKAIIRAAKLPVFAMEYAAPSDLWCDNCGGMGVVYVFVAESGPFRDVPNLAMKEKDLVLHSVEDPMYGWVWYTGKTAAGTCPACKGMKRVKVSMPMQQFPTGQVIKGLVAARNRQHVIDVPAEEPELEEVEA